MHATVDIMRTINISPVLGYRQIRLLTTLATTVRRDGVRDEAGRTAHLSSISLALPSAQLRIQYFVSVHQGLGLFVNET
jgi:hypothetical protein